MSLRRFVALIGGIFHRKQIDRELNDEIQAHIEMEEADQRDSGASPHDARPRARKIFGSDALHRQDAREAWQFPRLESFWQDVRYGARTLARQPGFTAVVLLTLTLGIGATTAIFTVVDAVLLRPLPFSSPDRIVEVLNYIPKDKLTYMGSSMAKIAEWKADTDFFEEFQGFSPTTALITGESEPERIAGAYVTDGLLPFLGVAPEIGMGFSPGDGVPGRDHLVLLSQSFWRDRYGSDTGVVGRKINLNKEDFTVVGVAPANFKFPRENVKFWIPYSSASDPSILKHVSPTVITRIKPGLTIAQAQQRMDVITARLAKEKPIRGGWDTKLTSLDSLRAQPRTRTVMFVLLGAVAFVLIISCLNTANLLLSQSTVRAKEIAVRAALGAAPSRLARQLLTESVLLSLLGGTLGALFAVWGVKLISAAIPSEISFWNLNEIAVDKRILLFTFVISTLTGIVFGLVPALKASRVSLNNSLNSSGRTDSGSKGDRRLRNGLVFVQVALSLMLLIGAGLLMKSFSRLNSFPNGFDNQNLIAVDLILPSSKYAAGTQQSAFFNQIKLRLSDVAGTQSVAVAGGDPFSDGGISFGNLEVEARAIADADKNMVIPFTQVSSDYFAALGIPLLQGRTFTEPDARASGSTAIINRWMANQFWPDGNVIGKRFRIGDSSDPWITVVGIVGDVKEFDVKSKPTPIQLYFPLPAGATSGYRTLVIRTAGAPANMIPIIKSAIWAIDKDQPIQRIWTMDELMQRGTAGPRFYLNLMTMFAALALVLSLIGVYGVINYMVSRRTREISIRMALGARPRDVLRMVIAQGIAPSLLGILIGIGGAMALSKLLASLLYEVTPTDKLTYGLVSVAYISIALVACYLPARRAASVDPLEAFRIE
jgi:putative ABC transport system permease protein